MFTNVKVVKSGETRSRKPSQSGWPGSVWRGPQTRLHFLCRKKFESSFKRELSGLKWVGNTTKQFTHKREPQFGRGLFGVHLLILRFKFQFSKSIESSQSNDLSLDLQHSQFHLFFKKTFLVSQKCPKITAQNRKTLVNEISRRIWRCLKRERDRYRQKCPVSDVKTAFTFFLA